MFEQNNFQIEKQNKHENIFFDEFYLTFENTKLKGKTINIPINECHFGILNLKSKPTLITEEAQEFLFVIDCSGSMSDICSDGRTKMHHTTHTLKNMILYFNENPALNINLIILAFDDKIHNILERTPITKNNIEYILKKIDNIRPKDSTNIELALKTSKEYIIKLQADYPTHQINHIFMTDGEVTVGSKDHQLLHNLVVVEGNIMNAFIGFGLDHDAFLLNNISDNHTSSYYFIDNLEKSGLVYGEILNNILYKLLSNTQLSIYNGYIYNYKTNEWVTNLYIGEIVSESNKIYSIISYTPDNCIVKLKATNSKSTDKTDLQNIGEFVSRYLKNVEFNIIRKENDDNTDLIKYIYRQKTLDIMYEANSLQRNTNNINNKHSIDDILDLLDTSKKNNEDINQIQLKKYREDCKNLKIKMQELLKEFKNYMSINNCDDDKMMKNLCDDIMVCYKTFGTYYGNMFIHSRQLSQGTHRCYSASNTPTPNKNIFTNDDINNLERTFKARKNTNTNPSPILFPTLDSIPINVIPTNISISDFYSDNTSDNTDDEFTQNYQFSNYTDTPYSTPTATKLMNTLTQTYNDICSKNFNKSKSKSNKFNKSFDYYGYSSDEEKSYLESQTP